MLEEKSQIINFELKLGKILRYMGKDAEPKEYKKIGGIVRNIRAVTKEIKAQKIRFMYVYLKDTDAQGNDVTYAVQMPVQKGAGPNVLRSLVYAIREQGGIAGKQVIFDVYAREKNGISYTNATVYIDDKKLDWVELPKGVAIDAALEDFITEINQHLGANSEAPAEQSNANFDDDMPGDDAPAGGYNPFARFNGQQ